MPISEIVTEYPFLDDYDEVSSLCINNNGHTQKFIILQLISEMCRIQKNKGMTRDFSECWKTLWMPKLVNKIIIKNNVSKVLLKEIPEIVASLLDSAEDNLGEKIFILPDTALLIIIYDYTTDSDEQRTMTVNIITALPCFQASQKEAIS